MEESSRWKRSWLDGILQPGAQQLHPGVQPTAQQLHVLWRTAQFIHFLGAEDSTVAPGPLPAPRSHNAPFPRSPWEWVSLKLTSSGRYLRNLISTVRRRQCLLWFIAETLLYFPKRQNRKEKSG